jgi:hypothetical protein
LLKCGGMFSHACTDVHSCDIARHAVPTRELPSGLYMRVTEYRTQTCGRSRVAQYLVVLKVTGSIPAEALLVQFLAGSRLLPTPSPGGDRGGGRWARRHLSLPDTHTPPPTPHTLTRACGEHWYCVSTQTSFTQTLLETERGTENRHTRSHGSEELQVFIYRLALAHDADAGVAYIITHNTMHGISSTGQSRICTRSLSIRYILTSTNWFWQPNTKLR